MKSLILSIILLLFINCKDHHHDHSKHKAMPASKNTEGSLFDMEDEWTTQEEKSIQWKNFKGEPFLLSMFYTTCQAVCPRIVSDMQLISKKINKKTGKTPKMVIVSFDPSKDSPQALKEYAKKMELGENWFLLNGNESSVRTLSVLLGISYQKTSGNDFNHSTIISLISREGKISTRIEGIGADSSTIVEKYE